MLLVLAACSVPVAGGLDEGQANRVVVALDRAGLGAAKESDPASEGRFRVMVEQGEAPHAIAPKPTASVLLKHRGSTPPIDVHEVKRLVAGAAPGLAPEDVAVVMIPRPVTASADRTLSRLGPITATRSSVALLRLVTAGIVVVALALLLVVLVLWTRLRRLRAAALEEGPDLQQARRI